MAMSEDIHQNLNADCIYGLVFFGVPNLGIEVEHWLPMFENQYYRMRPTSAMEARRAYPRVGIWKHSGRASVNHTLRPMGSLLEPRHETTHFADESEPCRSP